MSFFLSNTELSAKDTKRGKRIFISNAMLAHKSNLSLGDRLAVHYDYIKKQVTLTKAKDGDKNTVSVTPSGKRLVVDLHNKSVAQCFGVLIKTVSVLFYKGKLIIKATRAAVKAYQRILAAKERLRSNQPLIIGEACHGIGGLGIALSTGFKRQGSGLKLAFANDHDIEALEASIKQNPEWHEDTIALHCSMEQIPVELLPQVDFLVAGLSCKGASKQARTGKKISAPEFHPEAGWLIAPFYHLIASGEINPLGVIVENVPEYLDTGSAEILRQSMDRLGYNCHETILRARDFGCMENRKRMAMVFMTKGISLDLTALDNYHTPVTTTLADIIEHDSAPAVPDGLHIPERQRNGWYLKERLLEREQEAIAKGKGHRARIITKADDKVSTILSSYSKGVRLDESVVESLCGKWLRLLTPKEHAQIKGLPVNIISESTKTTAHRLLGNSITVAPWVAMGQVISASLNAWAFNVPTKMAA